jgi:hypothetical protein
MINIPMSNPNLELYLEQADPQAIRFDGLDYAIIGTDQDGLLVYDYNRMLEVFMSEQGMDLEEAVDWIDYNVMGVMGGKGFTVIYSEEHIL